MKLLVELPSWLGDTLMATPAIENVIKNFNDVEMTILGSSVSINVLKDHPRVVKTHILDKKISSFFKIKKELGKFDLCISFRSSLRSKIYMYFMTAKSKFQYDKKNYTNMHQVEKYNGFINSSLGIESIPGKLTLHNIIKHKTKKNKLIGLNPGASFGAAKRWHPSRFADLACDLSLEYDLVIFGGPSEIDISKKIEDILTHRGIVNFQNMAGKTSIKELILKISDLDLFVTGDSGPMHLAAALNIPTVSIFGPTNHNETSQWMNKKSFILKKNLDCQPCMKKSCPLIHHNCMKMIFPSDVIKAIDHLKS